ncbi:hypothetical protein K435DRAFT_207329 [Dendrothele bispora CBS 962.96]|uniref:HAD-like protein n=1 Tax=Dendrothele bispora (strain CBS 962.96) TaxID=1314807 RepID=A0A4S8MPJ2_DENBC|nr:hypothetical protein K435DRAFT_207329 [Dendrothele bispora CBS 962.96]
MTPMVPPTAIIFDLGDVLFLWSPETKTNISAKVLHQILSSSTWYEYECGKLTAEQCYQRVGQEFDLPAVQFRPRTVFDGHLG